VCDWKRGGRGFEVRCSGKGEEGGEILSEIQGCECDDEKMIAREKR